VLTTWWSADCIELKLYKRTTQNIQRTLGHANAHIPFLPVAKKHPIQKLARQC